MTHADPAIPDQPQPEIQPPDSPGPDIDPAGTPDEIPQFEQDPGGGGDLAPQGSA